ncbi:MAG: 4Fe-4S binding protein [Candidatus Thalassarchaeaceae archaeon]|jgi:ferredoxin|nr:4Fe-4S binding protein [Candidatus Thalassarchaeaceae archaeon]
MGQAMVEIIEPDCTGCDLCITHCPFEALLPLSDCPEGRRKRPVIVLNEKCVGCLSCLASCPTSALREVIIPAESEISPLIVERERAPSVESVNRWGKDGNKWA